MERVHKIVEDAQAASTNATIPSDIRDYATALRDRMVMLRDYINDNLPTGFDPIAEFDPIPE